jgi:cysteinyl-tRNA synthetase
MSEAELGLPFDIHGGGSDLIFPHHENEIAQSEAATGKPFAMYWLHGGMLQINHEKMSKSLGNFMLLRDVLERYDKNLIRLLMLQTHYRSQLDFSDARLDETKHAYNRLANLVRNIRWARDLAACGFGVPDESVDELKNAITATREKFDAEMDDDFNTAGALAAVFELAKHANTFLATYQVDLCEEDRQVLCGAEDAVVELLGVLGIEIGRGEKAAYPPAVFELARDVAGYEGADAEEAVNSLLATRAAARTEKNWELADVVRNGLTRLGFHIEDTPQGARVVYKPQS